MPLEILHQTTTTRLYNITEKSCILSKFYIKPQRRRLVRWSQGVVSYRNSTSNHNSGCAIKSATPLYLIEILHQTTTSRPQYCRRQRCILSKFYIKPQRRIAESYVFVVVSYRNSTSNHNSECAISLATPVVSYRNSTSNHNECTRLFLFRRLYLIEILHQTTTAAEEQAEPQPLYLIEILHQTTTSADVGDICRRCILSKFYIKPQQDIANARSRPCCILSKFYIKPQLKSGGMYTTRGCILSKFYIKPQHYEDIHKHPRGCILSKFYIKPQRERHAERGGCSCILSKFYIKPQP